MTKRDTESSADGRFAQKVVGPWHELLRHVIGLATSTCRAYRGHVLAYIRAERIASVDSITTESLVNHLRRLQAGGASSATCAAKVSALRQWCSWLTQAGHLPENPARTFRARAAYSSEPDTLTPLEIRRMIYDAPLAPFSLGHRSEYSGMIRTRDRTMLAVLYCAGLRASEVGRLRTEDCRIGRDAIATILVRQAKSARRDHRLALNRETSDLLTAWIALRQARGPIGPYLFPVWRTGSPSTAATARRVFHTARLAARPRILPRGRHLSTHTLRHSIASHMAEAGCTLADIQRHLRHANPATSARYLHTTDLHLRNAMRRFKPGRPAVNRRLTALATPPQQQPITALIDGSA